MNLSEDKKSGKSKTPPSKEGSARTNSDTAKSEKEVGSPVTLLRYNKQNVSMP